jgi:hypothetical protein
VLCKAEADGYRVAALVSDLVVLERPLIRATLVHGSFVSGWWAIDDPPVP